MKNKSDQENSGLTPLQLELLDSQRMLSTLMNNLPGMAYRCLNDKDWTMEFISCGCMELTGYAVDELVWNRVRSYNDIIHPHDQSHVWNQVQEGVNNRRHYRITYRIITKAGNIKWVWEQGSGVFSNAGQLIALEGFITDISTSKNYEEKLIESERRMFTLMSNLPGIAYRCRNDSRWTMEFISSGCRDITGYNVDELIGNSSLSFNDIIHEEDREIVWEHVQDAMSRFEAYEIRYRIRRKEGNVAWVWEKGRGIYNTAKEVEALEGFIMDITEMVKKDDQIRQIQKTELIGTLAGGIAHDFNNILGGIMGSADLLWKILERQKLNEPDQITKYMTTIKNASTRASELIKQLLILSRKHELMLKPVDLNLSVNNVVAICQSSFPKSIEITTGPYRRPAMVIADPTHMEQVILNLCVNASHAMTIMRGKDEKEGGQLHVKIDKITADSSFCKFHAEAKEGYSYYILKVKDTGVGIDKTGFSRLFEPFFSTKKESEGSGLGLSIVFSIIKQYDGFIDVFSEKGKGSEFQIFIPLLKSDEQVIIEEECQDQTHSETGIILVVDDEEIMRTIAEGTLKECGYEVITAESGSRALEIFREQSGIIDIVLLDLMMPGMSGRDLFIELKKSSSQIKVILATGVSEEDRIEEMLSMGAVGFIKKPYDLAELTSIVKSILRT